MKKSKQLIEKIKIYITKCSPQDFIEINVTELARIFYITVPHLSRTFKKEQGIKLSNYLQNEKIARSRLLLNNNLQLTINEIAEAIGYKTTDYFIRIFKKQTGITPDQYRRATRRFYGSEVWKVGTHERRSRLDRRKYFPNIIDTNHHNMVNDRRLNLINRRKSWFIV